MRGRKYICLFGWQRIEGREGKETLLEGFCALSVPGRGLVPYLLEVIIEHFRVLHPLSMEEEYPLIQIRKTS